MRVLSLFDGISCAYEGLIRAKVDVKEYYACEIDKHAIKVSQSRHPDIIRPVNDVRFLSKLMLPEIDLLVGGSPCQDLSIAKKNRKGLEGDRSGLFWEYVRVLKEVKPKHFILENVASMSKADKDLITETLGVEPVLFNASLVSAQTRKRLFWTNISFTLPEDRGIALKDILQPDVEGYDVKGVFHKTAQTGKNKTKKVGYIGEGEQYGQGGQAHRVYDPSGKTPTLSSYAPLVKLERIRKLTPIECERLQGLPDDYTAGISKSQRYKCLGNAFNVDVIACIVTSFSHP